MAYGPPPIPRKPASYSPSFLAQRDADYFNSGSRHNYASDLRQYSDENYHEYDEYDPDFSLDTYQVHSRSRPSSNGSAYGRPLPSPPGSQRVDMPHLNQYQDYADVLDTYNYDYSPVTRTGRIQQQHHMPHSQSQSSLSSNKPLPEPPSTRIQSHQRGQSQQLDPYSSQDYLYTHDVQSHHYDYIDAPDRRQPDRSSQGSVAISNELDYGILAPVTLPPFPYNTQYSENENIDDLSAYQFAAAPRHEINNDFRASSSIPLDYHSWNRLDQGVFDQSKDHRLADDERSTNEHTRHISHEVADLYIPALESSYDRDLYQEQYYQRQRVHAFDIHNQKSNELDEHFQHRFRSSTDSTFIDFYETQYQELINTAQTFDYHTTPPPVTSNPKIKSTGDAARSTLARPSGRPRGHSQGLPSPDKTKHATLRLLPKSKTITDLSRHRARSSTASAADLRSAQIDTKIGMAPSIPPGTKVTMNISHDDFAACKRPWSRSELFTWGRIVGIDSTVTFLEVYGSLFRYAVPALVPSAVYKISFDLLQSFLNAGEIVQAAPNCCDITFIDTQAAQGILPAICNEGCYTPRCAARLPYRCYSLYCSHEIQNQIRGQAVAKTSDINDWAQAWALDSSAEPLLSLDKSEVQRQYQIHEIIYSERDYLENLTVMRDVFQKTFQPINAAEAELSDLIFGHFSSLIKFSEYHLMPILQERQGAQGPVIKEIGDIFETWIPIARVTYVKYASQLQYADRAIRARRLRNPRIQNWLKLGEQDTRVKKLDFFSFQGLPTRRMQRYALLLGEVLKKTPATSSDYASLQSAIALIKSVCVECDAQVKEAQDKIALIDLKEQLVWRVSQRDLGLGDSGRHIYHRSDLQRKNESSTSWQTRDVILLDNFLLCVKSKDNLQRVISRPPIPIDYLVVEDFTEVLYKSSSTRLLGGTITHAKIPGDTTLRRSTTEHTLPVLPDGPPSPGKASSEDLYPFTVRHAGKVDDKMTFFAESASARTNWLKAIESTRTARWQKVCFREPFEVAIIADQAFGRYAGVSGSGNVTGAPSSAVEHAILNRDNVVLKSMTMSRIQCSTVFRKSDGTEAFLIGTDDGIYSNYHGSWTRLVTLLRVSQVAMLEDFGVLTVLADKILIAYTIDDLLNVNDVVQSTGMRKPPQRLSGSKDVGFFEVGILKDRMLVIYKKRENGNSVFKALEPVVGKKLEKKSFFKKGSGTDFFRDFDQFFIPAECYGMQYLRSTICIKCSRGFEIMSLDSKQPLTIPDLSGPNTTSLRTRVEGARPLGTYRVQEGEFLCCYTECGLFVDKYGSVSRPYTLEWEGRPTHAVLVGNYVLAIGKEFIEVWNIDKRSLRQIIIGRDIRLIPHSSAGSGIDISNRGVVIAMDNPRFPGKQLIFELKLRDTN